MLSAMSGTVSGMLRNAGADLSMANCNSAVVDVVFTGLRSGPRPVMVQACGSG
jgi:hypothetical protein